MIYKVLAQMLIVKSQRQQLYILTYMQQKLVV